MNLKPGQSGGEGLDRTARAESQNYGIDLKKLGLDLTPESRRSIRESQADDRRRNGLTEYEMHMMRQALKQQERDQRIADTLRAALWTVIGAVVFVSACMGAVRIVDALWK